MSKQNDLMFTLLGNPLLTTEDFLKVGLSADNTSLEDESIYKNLKDITENPLFLNSFGEFDENKFHLVYIGASQIMQQMATNTNKPQAVYSKYNIFAPVELRDMSPLFELVNVANPDRITKSIITIGQDGAREKTPSEIAQSQQTWDTKNEKWVDSPEDLFSIGKLFEDFTGFFSDNFGKTKVLALYENDVDINGNKRGEIGFDENHIEHYKGEYMLNDNGTYYYRTLKDGENIYGKQVLHFSDILTRENSALNSIDFLDSDDLQKSTFGSIVKNAALVTPLILGTGIVGVPATLGTFSTWLLGATIFLLAAGLGATLGKMALLDSNNVTMNWIEGLVESTNPIRTRSEYSSGDKMWTMENFLGMTADVIALLAQLRMIFKWAPVITKGKWGISEKTQEALKTKYTNEILAKNKNSLLKIIDKFGKDSVKALTASAELLGLSQMAAAALVEDYMKDYQKAGEVLSKAYMTLLTVNDIYGEAKEAGAGDFDSALITAGYAAMEYALLSTDIGKWILPELRAARLENKAIVRALTKDTLEAFKKLGVEAKTSEVAKRTYLQKLIDFGKNIARGEFNVGLEKRAAYEGGEGLLKAGLSSLFAGASAEAVEETTEEVLADFSRVLFNGLQLLKGSDVRMKAPWEDDHLFDRYAMSFLGGFMGGGISSATFDFSQTRRAVNMTYNLAVLLLIWKARNNDLDGIYKILNKEEIGNKYLSSSKTVEDENGNLIWQLGTESDNLDLTVKNLLKRLIKLLLDTLEAHGGNLSDDSLLDAQVLKDLRYRTLYNTTTAGKYIQKYNSLITDLIDKTSQLRLLDSTIEKIENGETDKQERTTGKSKETEQKRKKLEEEIKNLDELIDNFNTGKLAPLFMTSALLESTPFISSVFMTSSFRNFAESKAKTKYENIPEGELKNYLNEYLNYLRTSKKDDLDFATEGYLALSKLIGSNFEEAIKIAESISLDEELRNLLEANLLDTTMLLNSETDDDSWLEVFLNYVNHNPFLLNFETSIQLIKNTAKEAIKGYTEKHDSDIVLFRQQLEDGIIDEETYNNSVKKADEDLKSLIQNALDLASENILDLNTQIWIDLASKLADKFINLGYINGSIKDSVIGKLNELITKLTEHLGSFGEVDSEFEPEKFEKYINLDGEINSLKNKINKVRDLKYTPILLNLDLFALNLNGSTVSKVLEELGRIILTNKTNISAFTFSTDVHHAINEADRVIDLYIAALEGARIDTVDPFSIDKTNVWGINKVINEIHSKAPKIENDTWEDLPEIEGDIANMLLMDAKSIKNTLLSYKKLFNINRGQKLEIQSRVGARTSYLLYDRINRLLANTDFPKDFEGYEKFRQTIENLKFFNENVKDKDKKDWKINLNLEEQIALEKDKIEMEDAIYDLFNNSNIDRLEEFFNFSLFNLGDSRTTLLTEDSEDIDESSIIGYIASKIAIKSSDFHKKYLDLIKTKDAERPIAPILGQELGVLLGLANILNGPIITKVIYAYRNSIYNKVKSLTSFKEKSEFLEKIGLNKNLASLFATETGFNKYFASYDLVPLYSNITFVDGVAGSGKTTAIDANIIKYLLKYNPEILSKVWTVHGGDNKDSILFAKGLRTSIGLSENNSDTFNKYSFMNIITPDRADLTIGEGGKSYEFRTTDYKYQNGKIVPTWTLNNMSELPSLIVIDEALQFTLLDLLTIDRFAREHGISVIMSGDLQQSLMNGKIKMLKEDISVINAEIKSNGLTNILFTEKSTLTLKLHRNLVLHSPKIGTSMRTENNQKNMNMATIQAIMDVGSGNVNLHFFESDTDIAGDVWVTPNLVDEVKRILDKIFGNLVEGEKVNFAYNDENSEVFKALKADNKYWDKINPIKGVALGLEGNYWLVDINPNQPTDSYLLDLYTGITRAKKASIVIADKNPVVLNKDGVVLSRIDITYNGIKDSESHSEKYSNKAINQFIDKRVKILEGALTGNGNKIPFNKRLSLEESRKISTEVSESSDAINKSPIESPISLTELPMSPTVSISEKTEETVITEGINTIAEELREVFNPEATAAQREIDINNFLKRNNVKNVLKTYGLGLNTIKELVDKVLDNEENEEVKLALRDALRFDSSKKILLSYLTPDNGQLALEFEDNPTYEMSISTDDIDEDSESEELKVKEKNLEETIESNISEFDNHTVTGLSLKDFSFFIFSNASFEYGTNKINSNGTFEPSIINKRIDSFNGLYKLGINNVKLAELKLATIRDLLMSIEDKSLLELYISNELEIKETYVRFAIKTSEFSEGGNGNFDKLDKEGEDKKSVELLPYARAQIDKYSESKTANNRHIVAIIGTETLGDLLELPLLTLNNPLSIIDAIENNLPKYPTVYYPYHNAYNKLLNYALSQPLINNPENFAMVHALDELISIFDSDPLHLGIINLIKIFRATNRHITFIDDPNWTIGKNLHSFGPQLNIGRGIYYTNTDYIQTINWISLNTLKKDPQLKFSSIMLYTDKSGLIEDPETGELITLVRNPKHPFILFTDTFVDHNGRVLSSDTSFIEEFEYQRTHPNVKQTIKLVYVLPPTYTLREYIDSLIDFTNNGGKYILGNLRTPYKILEGLIYDSEGNVNTDTVLSFQNALGTDTGKAVYNKVKEIIDLLKPLDVNQQIKLLTNSTPLSWDINGFGLLKEVLLYQQLQNVLKQLIYPTSITIEGNINHKGTDRRDELIPTLLDIFNRSNLKLFFLTRGSREQDKIIFGRYSPILEVGSNYKLTNTYVQNKDFMVNGNLSSSTFMADELFNIIITKSIAKWKHIGSLLITDDTKAYINGYSGFNKNRGLNSPTIHPNIVAKLKLFGLTTSVVPKVPNDISIAQDIVNEINSNIESPIRAFILPNGEFLIGSNNLFKGKLVLFNLGTNPFESLQSYMFEVIIDGIVYDANYTETNSGKNLELTLRNKPVSKEYILILPEIIIKNEEQVRKLLQILSSSSKPIQSIIERILAESSDTFAKKASAFLNNSMGKRLIEKFLSQNFDFSEYNNILELEQSLNGCTTSINIKLI